MSRPRRTTAAKASSSRTNEQRTGTSNSPTVADPEVDPEFLSLTAKQRKAIDRAFVRGLKTLGRGRQTGTRSAKRRKLDTDGAHESRGPGGSDAGGGFVLDPQDGGGFMDDDDDAGGGGFMLDEGEGEGGFMVDDDAEGAGGFMPEDAGGFLPDDQAESMSDPVGGYIDTPGPSTSRPKSTTTTPGPTTPIPVSSSATIPLYILPGLLTSLGLPSDEDVLGVFRASASGWEDDEEGEAAPARRKKDITGEMDEDAGGVLLKDFRAVCAALVPSPSTSDDGQGDDVDVDMSPDEDEGASDDFELSEEDSELSSLSGSEYGGGGKVSKTRVQGKSKSGARPSVKSTDFAQAQDDHDDPGPSRKTTRRSNKRGLVQDSEGKVKLSSRQKELAKDIWEMLKPPAKAGGPGTGTGTGTKNSRGREAEILSRDEVHKWVRTLGEMWDQAEITDMVTLFSTQHEGRGLSFDDFGAIMLRAGLV
ncbi:hypothetical protein IAU59_005298 [Kwoniella sp. CBS 9459]